MKHLIIALILSLTPFISQAGNIVSQSVDTTVNGDPTWTIVVHNEGTEFVYYEFTSRYENGKISRKGILNEYGKRSGTWVSYYEDGTKCAAINYKHGLKHGKQYVYAKNGNIVLYGEYRDGKKHGTFETYSNNGETLVAAKVFKRDKLKESYEWHEDNGGLLIVKL